MLLSRFTAALGLVFVLQGEAAIAESAIVIESSSASTPTEQIVIQSIESNSCLSAEKNKIFLAPCAVNDRAQVWEIRKSNFNSHWEELRSAQTKQCLRVAYSGRESVVFLGACGNFQGSLIGRVLDPSEDRARIRFLNNRQCLSSKIGDLSERGRGYINRSASCDDSDLHQIWAFATYPIKSYSWNDHITSNCYVFNDYQANGWWRIPNFGNGKCNSEIKNGAWVIASYNEGIPNKYIPGEIIPATKIGPGRLWDFSFLKQDSNQYSIMMSLNKVSESDYLDQFTWVGIQDSFDRNRSIPRPDLSENLYIDLKIAVHQASRGIYDNVTGDVSPKEFWEIGKSRVHLGVMLRWESMEPAFRVRETYNLEIVFWRDPEYDGCTAKSNWWGPPAHALTTPCDSSDVYDRRAAWGDPNTGNGGGEAVYYTGPGVQGTLGYSLPMASPNGQLFTYRIPLSKLVKAYKWKRPPPSWSNVKVAGVYMGGEAWGKAKVTFEIKDYRLYALPSTKETSVEK
jgi:hypothetical protein